MLEIQKLKKRDIYIKKLIRFQDTEPVKVITGIRRCGKSSLPKLMIQHLQENGIQPEQIVEMNFESHDFRSMMSDEVYRYVKEKIVPDKRMQLLFDELQRVDAWEDAVNSLCVDFDGDIYHRFQCLFAVIRIFHLSFRPIRAAFVLPGIS